MTELEKNIKAFEVKTEEFEKEVDRTRVLIRVESLMALSEINENTYFYNQLKEIKKYINNNN
jgi:hypothetical protein